MKRNYICPEFREIRIESKDHWSKTFRTTNPYDINKRTRNNGNDNNSFIRRTFSLVPRSVERSNRSFGNTVNIQELCFSFLNELSVILQKSGR